MSSISEPKKCFKGLYVSQYEDRITNLPINLVTKILSSLPTKHAVATSVLSRKWKGLWYSVTKLEFDDGSPLSYNTLNSEKEFTHIVNKVLLLREKSCLERFCLKCFRVYDDSFVNVWLISVLQCKIQELDIFIKINQSILLPSEIFLCSTLKVLKLDLRGCVNMHTSARLPNLKSLHINGIQLPNDMSITSLLVGCPVLEELLLSNCLSSDVRVVNITACALKRLTMKYLAYDFDLRTLHNEYQIIICTPALEYLCFQDHIAKGYVISNMDHLTKAEINFDGMREEKHKDQFSEIYSKAVNDVLNRISQVENLVLSCDSMEVIYACHLRLPKFSNLTCLKLYMGGDLLSELLANSPCLQTLHIQQEGGNGGECLDILSSPVPSCFFSHLKEIEIVYLERNEDEMQFMGYVLKNCKVLEKLTLHFAPVNEVDSDTDVEWPKNIEAEVLKELLALPRASSLCRVVVIQL